MFIPQTRHPVNDLNRVGPCSRVRPLCNLLFILFTALSLFLTLSQSAHAAIDCPFWTTPPSPLTLPINNLSLNFSGENIQQELDKYPSGGELKFSFPDAISCPNTVITDIRNPSYSVSPPNPFCNLLTAGQHPVEIVYEYSGNTVPICSQQSYVIEEQPSSCTAETKYSGKGDVEDATWEIIVSNVRLSSPYTTLKITIDDTEIIYANLTAAPSVIRKSLPASVRTAQNPHTIIVNPITVVASVQITEGPQLCTHSFSIAPKGQILPSLTPSPTPRPICFTPACRGSCSGDCRNCPACNESGPVPIPKLKPICEQIDAQFKAQCENCNNQGKIWTAIGCLPTDFSVIIKDVVFKTGLGIAGGMAFLYFLYGSFLVLTSTGNPEVIAQGKQVITSALSGLFLIIFSIFFLRVIGVDILQIPGFS